MSDIATLPPQAELRPAEELAAGIRYLNQRYSMPNDACKSILTDIGTEEPVPHYCRGNKGEDRYYTAFITNKPYRQ